MKKMIFFFGLILLVQTSAQAKVSVPEGRYVFSLPSESGSVSQLQIQFQGAEGEQGDVLLADLTATLRDGKTLEGQMVCEGHLDKGDISCRRDDGAGRFRLQKSKTISGDSFKYTFSTKYLLMSEGEGEEEDAPLAEIKLADGKLVEVTGTKEAK